jgi:hypothetical protein
MPSTLVHAALAGLLAAALLGEAYDRRAVAVVLGVTAAADLDAFAAFVTTAGHRTLLHTFLLPVAAGAILYWDTGLRAGSTLRARYGARGVRVAWVTVLAYAVSAVGLDFVTGGVNPLFPLHDQLYVLDGKIELSSKQGIVQTFVETSDDSGGAPAPTAIGSSENVTVTTGVDPEPGGGVEDVSVERIVPVVRAGWQLLVMLVGAGVTAARFALPHTLPEDG